MLVRYMGLKDTHDFITKFIRSNDTNNVKIRNIEVQDSAVKCIISVRNDDIRLVKMPFQYKDVQFKILDRNLI